MYCFKCGNKIDDEDLFCGGCGARQEEEPSVEESISEETIEAAIEEKTIAEEPTVEETQLEDGEPVPESNEAASALEVQPETGLASIETQELVAATVEQPVGEIITAQEVKKKKRWVVPVIIISVLAVIVLPIVSLLIYTNVATYDIPRVKTEFDEYIVKESEFLQIRGSTAALTLDDELLNAGIEKFLPQIQTILGDKVTCVGGYVDVEEERIYMNTKAYGMNVPLSARIQVELDDEAFITFDKFQLGKLPIPGFMVGMFVEELPLEVRINEFIPAIFEVAEFEHDQDAYILEIEINYENALKEIESFRKYADPTIVDIYQNLMGEGSYLGEGYLIGNLLSDQNELTVASVRPYVQELMTHKLDRDLVETLLIVLDKEGRELFEATYGHYYEFEIKEQDLEEKQNDLLIQGLVNQVEELFIAIDHYRAYEGIQGVSNQGILYDRVMKRDITVSLLKEKQYLDSDNRMFDNSTILYDPLTASVHIVYKNGDVQFKVAEDGSYIELTDQDLENLYANQTGEAELLSAGHPDRIAIEQVLTSELGEKQYIRHMKSDGTYAFVVASSVSSQNYIDQYLMKSEGGKWTIEYYFSETEDVIDKLNVYCPEANLNTLPAYDLDDYYVNILSVQDYETLAEIINYHTGMDPVDIAIEFASMSGDIVYTVLENGRKFIYYNISEQLVEVSSYADILSEMAYEYDPPMFIFLQE